MNPNVLCYDYMLDFVPQPNLQPTTYRAASNTSINIVIIKDTNKHF